MRWLNRVRSHVAARVGGESGVTIVFVSIVLLLLLAFTALVIDFGRIWQERRELQLGATAGALAVAEDCARSLCDVAYDGLLIADTYADANATDGAASAFGVDIDLGAQSVYVATATENSAGGNFLPMLFAGIVGFERARVSADAAAAWGTPLEAATLPLIISDCEWNKADPGWPAGSPASLPDAGANLGSYPLATIIFQDPLGVGGEVCSVHPGLDLPGGFGWVDTSGGCVASVLEGGTISADPGTSPSTGCSPSDFENLLGEAVLIPYFDEIQGVGTFAEYTVAGHGAFVVAGYNFGGPYREYLSEYLPGLPCSGPTRCVAGWFVQQVTHGGGPGGFGGEDRGAVTIKLIA